MNEHYFSSNPTVKSEKKLIKVTLNDREYSLETDNGVFSNTRLDLGTQVLLHKAPQPPQTGVFLDAGCGWGPIALSLGLQSPKAKIYAVDINLRSLELTEKNAKLVGISNIETYTQDQGLEKFRAENISFDLIWSNPPIRVGKKLLHDFLDSYLSLLAEDGVAYLVVQKNLGADSCMKWLSEQGYVTEKYASQKGFRIIQVRKTVS